MFQDAPSRAGQGAGTGAGFFSEPWFFSPGALLRGLFQIGRFFSTGLRQAGMAGSGIFGENP